MGIAAFCPGLAGAAEPPPAAAVESATAELTSLPLFKTWKPAPFPAQVPADIESGTAVVRLTIDEHGGVTSLRLLEASHPAFGEAALAAARQWTFEPGMDQGKPAAMCIDAPFEFDRKAKAGQPGMLPPMHLMPYSAARVESRLVDAPLGEYPPSLLGRGLPGQVLFSARVMTDGTIQNLQIIHASHPDYVLPALESASSWRYRPAMNGDLPIAVEVRGEVTYGDAQCPPRSEILAVNGFTGPDGKPPENLPALAVLADPVWPHAQLLAGEGGTAAVELRVGPNGAIRGARVVEASHPDFGGALLAAVEASVFDPALVRGVGVEVVLLKRAEWKAIPLDASAEAEDWLTRLVALARAKAFRGGRGLDGRLTPIYRIAPERPRGIADDEKGEAVIEFVVDRDGRARLPRVVSATRPEFGWAAATAASQWHFKAPKRGGQPTEVIVQVPFGF